MSFCFRIIAYNHRLTTSTTLWVFLSKNIGCIKIHFRIDLAIALQTFRHSYEIPSVLPNCILLAMVGTIQRVARQERAAKASRNVVAGAVRRLGFTAGTLEEEAGSYTHFGRTTNARPQINIQQFAGLSFFAAMEIYRSKVHLNGTICHGPVSEMLHRPGSLLQRLQSFLELLFPFGVSPNLFQRLGLSPRGFLESSCCI